MLVSDTSEITRWLTVQGDINIFSAGSSNCMAGVIGLQGRAISSTAPSNGDVLTWNSSGSHWEPGSGTGITWGSDLNGSTTSNQYVVAITGSTGNISLGDVVNSIYFNSLNPTSPVDAPALHIISPQGYSEQGMEDPNSDGYKGGDLFIVASIGGDGTGTDHIGGNSGSLQLYTEPGGVSTGTADNSSSGNVIIATGNAGAGGSGAVGSIGTISLQPGNVETLTVSDSQITLNSDTILLESDTINLQTGTDTTVGSDGYADSPTTHPVGYVIIQINGTPYKLPYYNV
jgi:hypothetical protein